MVHQATHNCNNHIYMHYNETMYYEIIKYIFIPIHMFCSANKSFPFNHAEWINEAILNITVSLFEDSSKTNLWTFGFSTNLLNKHFVRNSW